MEGRKEGITEGRKWRAEESRREDERPASIERKDRRTEEEEQKNRRTAINGGGVQSK